MSPLHVLHVIAPGPLAGAERVVLAGAQAQREAGADVALLVLDERRAPGTADAFVAATDLPVHRVAVHGRLDPRALLAARRFAAQADVVHLHGAKPTAWLSPGPRSPVTVASHHGDTGHDARARLYAGLQARLYRRLRHVFAVSPESARLLSGRGVAHDRVSVLPNPLTRAVPRAAPRAHGPLRLLFIGRLSPEKQVLPLLEAVAAHPDAHLTVLGDGPERAAAEARARRPDLAQRVTFAGFVEAIGPHLQAADALVLPSLREGEPLVVLEALVAGLPVVASAVGSVPDLIADAGGLLVPPGDGPALARALRSFEGERGARIAAARRAAPAARARTAPARWAQAGLFHYGALGARPATGDFACAG